VRVSEIDSINAAKDPVFAKETLDGVPPFNGHLVPTVGTGRCGLGKLMALARPALSDLLQTAGLSTGDMSRIGLCLCLSDGFYQSGFGERPEPIGQDAVPSYETVWSSIASVLPDRLCDALNLPIPRDARWVSRRGRLALLGAIHQASQWFSSGTLSRCLIGTVESCVESAALLAYGAARVVKSDANPVGFMPGEAAAFVLVEPDDPGRGEPAHLRIVATTHAVDAAYLDPEVRPLGRGICEVAQQIIVGRSTAKRMPELIVTDLNGTDMRASDWGHALVHLRDRFGEFSSEVWLPVESFGETGAATGGLGLCMVFEAARRGRLPGATALLVLCAEAGGRGAVLLEAPAATHL
jgi:3-oxoacyl-[acyl-carrier-protein] synthase-1